MPRLTPHCGLAAAALCLLALCQLAIPLPGRAADSSDGPTPPETWSLHAQSTLTWQGYPAYRAAFSGANSLAPEAQDRETYDATLFLGARLVDGLAFYMDPEIDQGFGLSNTLGVAGFPSGEAYKIGQYPPYFRMQRAFLRYVVDLGGDTVQDAPGANQLAGSHRQDNLTITIGKFGVTDLFDSNGYAHDPRADFLNWSIIDSGAFDYAADAWGFTYGAAAEWTQSWWTLRTGVFDLSRMPNTPQLVHGFSQFAVVAEAEERHVLGKQPGSVKLLAFANRANMGSYGDAVALGQQTGTAASTALVRRYATRPGVAVNAQQQLDADLGVFLRASINDGSEEAYDFTDINRSLSTGLSLQGARWGRPSDTVGVAGAINALSSAAQRYFAAGGLGILIGDGALPDYGREKIVEAYYSCSIATWATLSLDYQFVDNPAYDRLRGPVSIFGLRAHADF